MAGVKGKSGGARAGAGRKPKFRLPNGDELTLPSGDATPPAEVETRDPLEFLLDVMQGRVDPNSKQLRAGIAATQYVHAKKEGGKKEAADKKAKDASGGRFGAAAPPKLVAKNGKAT